MTKLTMGPPPPRTSDPAKDEVNPPSETGTEPQEQHQGEGVSDNANREAPVVESADKQSLQNPRPAPASGAAKSISVPYTIPPWSERSCQPYFLEVLKDGSIVDRIDVSSKGAYMFGRLDLCDFMLEHPTISRFHAVLQFKGNGDAFLFDLNSTHGTFVNKAQIKQKVYTEVHVGDVFRFGRSSRLYIFQGPSELMPPERDLQSLRNAKMREEMQDREASLLRAKLEASLADGISWGMKEDAIEEFTEDVEEVTWQTYKGELTEKQEKTRSKILKRLEKVAHMKKEMDAIRAKDIAQGGLTQGQQTQIARNEQRTSRIMEELESLEETLNESIQESMGARAGNTIRGKKKNAEDEDDLVPSDDDEFYDRTKKRTIPKADEQQKIETADSLLDKKSAIVKEIEGKMDLLSKEKAKMHSETPSGSDGGDALDAFMTGLSSQLVLDVTSQLEKELSSLRSELDRIDYLLKIADPMGEAALRRDKKPVLNSTNSTNVEQKRKTDLLKPRSCVNKPLDVEKDKISIDEKEAYEIEKEGKAKEKADSEPVAYTISKPKWLGATVDMDMKENQPRETSLDVHESEGFIDYKDRKQALAEADRIRTTEVSEIEGAAPGLNIRKRKEPEKPARNYFKNPEVETPSPAKAETAVADAVALLLKHERGYTGLDEGEAHDSLERERENGKLGHDKPTSKRVLGPERPDFLDAGSEYESWIPPAGQSGDGRTALNDRYGY